MLLQSRSFDERPKFGRIKMFYSKHIYSGEGRTLSVEQPLFFTIIGYKTSVNSRRPFAELGVCIAFSNILSKKLVTEQA